MNKPRQPIPHQLTDQRLQAELNSAIYRVTELERTHAATLLQLKEARTMLRIATARVAELQPPDTQSAPLQMLPDGTEYVTTWTARKRHIAVVHRTHTLCHTVAVRPGDIYVRDHREPITQTLINRMPLCGQCARTIGKKHTP